jgi:hypothetical protein
MTSNRNFWMERPFGEVFVKTYFKILNIPTRGPFYTNIGTRKDILKII